MLACIFRLFSVVAFDQEDALPALFLASLAVLSIAGSLTTREPDTSPPTDQNSASGTPLKNDKRPRDRQPSFAQAFPLQSPRQSRRPSS